MQQQSQKAKVNVMYADEVYSKMVTLRYGVTMPDPPSDVYTLNNLRELHDFYYPDIPFEKMTYYTLSKEIDIEIFNEKFNLL